MKSFLRLNDQSGVLRINDEKMLTKCSEHNLYSYQFLVKICAKVGSLREGKKIHALAVKFGFGLDLFIRHSFDSYAFSF